jgi:hypothetical protein
MRDLPIWLGIRAVLGVWTYAILSSAMLIRPIFGIGFTGAYFRFCCSRAFSTFGVLSGKLRYYATGLRDKTSRSC